MKRKKVVSASMSPLDEKDTFPVLSDAEINRLIREGRAAAKELHERLYLMSMPGPEFYMRLR